MTSQRSVVVLGAGGHAHSVIETTTAQRNWCIVGVLDDDPTKVGQEVLGHPVVGDRHRLGEFADRGVDGVVLALGHDHQRLGALAFVRSLGLEPVTVIHPSAVVMTDAVVGAGSFIHAQAIVGPACQLGEGVIVSSHVTVGHQSVLGDGVQLTPGARIGGGCRLGRCVRLGPNAVVYAGVSLGDDVDVWANSVVTHDTGPGVQLAGTPARVVTS